MTHAQRLARQALTLSVAVLASLPVLTGLGASDAIGGGRPLSAPYGCGRAGELRTGPGRDPAWGIAGPYGDTRELTDMKRRGVRFLLLEMRWSEAEPAQGRFDESYFTSVKRLACKWRSHGYHLMLNFGLDYAPDWLLDKKDARGNPIGRFVNEDGRVYDGSAQPNLIFSKALRRYAERYTRKVFSRGELGTQFYTVRVGGGYFGELAYPYSYQSNGRISDDYWAYDASARAQSPVPNYRPCSGDRRQTWRFLNWYFDELVDYQNWQVRTVRASYPGLIGVLYPSWGVRPGDFAEAVATNLCGRSSPEINGEIQRGVDHARQIRRLPKDRKIVIWGSWLDNAGYASWLFGLADRRGLRKMGENSGQGTSVDAMRAAIANVRRFGLTAFMWIRASQAYCFCGGFASMDDYQRLIKRE